MAKNEALFEAICSGNRKAVEEIVQGLIDKETNMAEVLNESMIPAMRNIGERFSKGEVYVPEMLIAARAMQTGIALMEPFLAKQGHKPLAKVCIGTVKGDLHDIGKNLVAMMLKGAGYEVDDLGVDCEAEKFKGSVAAGSQAVLCSALLTTTMPYMKEVVSSVREGSDVKVIIGGAPISQEYADEIGADGFGVDANDAVRVLDKWFAPA